MRIEARGTTVRISRAALLALLKECPNCHLFKPLAEFGLRQMDKEEDFVRPQSWCSVCRALPGEVDG